MTFLIEKMKLVSFSLFLDAPPPDPKCHLDNDMPLYTYTTYVKGVLGLGRGGRGCISKTRHQTSDKNGPRRKMVVLFVHVHQLYKYKYSIAIGRLFTHVLRSGSHTRC